MRTIWKFPLAIIGAQVVEARYGAQFLTVQMQGDAPCVWAIVDPQAEKMPVTFYIVGTGHPMPEGSPFYLGTFQMAGGALVFHVFGDVHSS